MKKLITIIAIYVALTAAKVDFVSAQAYVAGSSAQLSKFSQYELTDPRVGQLRAFLDQYNSPLAEYAEVFVAYADMYDIDWRLVPAISGVESTFGKRIPANSYNAYGWANGNYAFTSWEDSIEIVSRTLKERYIEKGALSINQIARRYAPPSSTWAGKVKYFMKKIQPLPVGYELEV
jgi:hypothetical protein